MSSARLICTLCWCFIAARSASAAQITGSGSEVGSNIFSSDGVTFDQILLIGATASVSADAGQTARVTFIDLNNDLVNVDFAGSGVLTLSLESASARAFPSHYNLPVEFMKGHAVLSVTGANATTMLRIWTSGRANTLNQAIFRPEVIYDGIADLKSITIAVPSAGAFGSLDASNVRFSGNTGVVGIEGAGVQFTEPVSIHDIEASNGAVPHLLFGGTADVRVLGGDLSQLNGATITTSGLSALTLLAGTNSHGVDLPQQPLRGQLLLSDGTPLGGLVILGPADPSFATGVSGTYTLPVASSSPMTFSLASGTLPFWATLNTSSGTISGTPTSTYGSPFVFDVTVDAASANSKTLSVTLTVTGPAAVAPTITQQPSGATVALGANATLMASAMGFPAPWFIWFRNGRVIPNENSATLQLASVTPEHAGFYTVLAGNDAGSVESAPAFVGVNSTTKTAGIAEEIASGIVHPATGNIYDQVLLKGAHALIKADPGEITRISFTDPNHDIVQVEFSGAGTVSLWLEGAAAPAFPVNYNQEVNYVRGHARLTVTGADQTTNLSVFSVGRANAVNQGLFRDDVVYDGVADLISISISSTDGKFGGLRTANVAYVGTDGVVGVHAPNVVFTGPVFVGDIAASDFATPTLLLGGSNDVRITGGDLLQPNGRAVTIKGITELQFRNGSTSHGNLFLAQANRGRLEQDGVDVTAQIARAPQP